MSSMLDMTRVRFLQGRYGTVPLDALHNQLVYSRVLDYRRSLASRMVALDREGLSLNLPVAEYVLSKKIDGEFTAVIFEGEEIFTINPGGTIRVGMPLLTEAKDALLKHGVHQILLVGELYYYRDGDERIRVHDVTRAARAPDTAEDLQRLRLAVFDIVDLEGIPLNRTYSEIMQLLNEIFRGTELVHPVTALFATELKAIEDAYSRWVESERAEGMVLRSEQAGIFKIKPRHSLDVAVIGFTEATGDRIGMLHDLLVAVMREEGTFHVLGHVGGGFSRDQRLTLLSDLKDRVAESDYHEVNTDRVAYQMVRPGLVVEISCLDLISTTTRGGTIDRMVIQWDEQRQAYHTIRRMPLASIISPQFLRVRDDKSTHVSDVRMKQLSDLIEIPQAEKNSLRFTLPPSSMIRREVRVKTLKGQKMVRKLLLWQTNKADLSPDYPAYVLCCTDFSPNRKTPLEREIRVSNSREQIDCLWEDLAAKYFVKGWNPV